jgi:Ser/Thr protein kinase RdoA (MazF antagonist)
MNADLSSHLARYDLANPLRIDLLKDDRAWRIEHASGNWVLSKRPMYDPASRRVERLEPASRLMTELHAIGQPWVCARKNINGQYITVDGEDLYQVTTYEEGNTDWENRSLEIIPDIGKAAGALHRYQETDFDIRLPNFDFDERAVGGLERRRDELREFGTGSMPSPHVVDEVIAEFRDLSRKLDRLPSGLIHMDLSPGNIVTREGRLARIIDFEAFPAPYLFDIGFAALYWTTVSNFESRETVINRHELKTLLQSYTQERPLAGDEREGLKDALIWCAIRWWSRQANQSADRDAGDQDPYRIYSRHDTVQQLVEIDEDWLAECLD